MGRDESRARRVLLPMRRERDQIIAIGTIAMHQHHQMAGRALERRQRGAGERWQGHFEKSGWIEREQRPGVCSDSVSDGYHFSVRACDHNNMSVTRFAPSPTGLLHL